MRSMWQKIWPSAIGYSATGWEGQDGDHEDSLLSVFLEQQDEDALFVKDFEDQTLRPFRTHWNWLQSLSPIRRLELGYKRRLAVVGSRPQKQGKGLWQEGQRQGVWKDRRSSAVPGVSNCQQHLRTSWTARSLEVGVSEQPEPQRQGGHGDYHYDRSPDRRGDLEPGD